MLALFHPHCDNAKKRLMILSIRKLIFGLLLHLLFSSHSQQQHRVVVFTFNKVKTTTKTQTEKGGLTGNNGERAPLNFN